jgi:hypothetical protein
MLKGTSPWLGIRVRALLLGFGDAPNLYPNNLIIEGQDEQEES